ncbi:MULTISPECIES: type IV secretion system protein [unclassified Cupriavidus]|uniref:type IV secretion system protein n=1 Tax=unclassified Cupriavidus TaxID=2640874 RepID=UPI0009F26A75|nr:MULTISPECIES: type IV secretion system protein [unclassified Cupriavidus]
MSRVALALLASLLSLLLVVTSADALAQSASASAADASSTAPTAIGKAGDAGKALSGFSNLMTELRGKLIPSATQLSKTLSSDANKFAYALAVITIIRACLAFSGSHHPISAWTTLLEEFMMLGIFIALYLGYTDAVTGLWNWFQQVGTQVNGGTPVYATPQSMFNLGSKLWDAWARALGDASGLSKIAAFISALPLGVAFLLLYVATIIYIFYVNLGDLQVAIGIVVGQIAVALGFASFTRKYFFSWLHYMITGCMYIVVAGIISNLVLGVIQPKADGVNGIGTDTLYAACYAMCMALYLCFVAMQIPSIAGSIFGTGGGVDGGGGLSVIGKSGGLAGKALKKFMGNKS